VESVWKIDAPPSRRPFGAVADGDGFHLGAEALLSAGGEERRPITLALAATNRDLVAVEVHILDPDGQRFEEAEAAAMEELREEAEGRRKPVQEQKDLAVREDGR
jgi:hypothetical protein